MSDIQKKYGEPIPYQDMEFIPYGFSEAGLKIFAKCIFCKETVFSHEEIKELVGKTYQPKWTDFGFSDFMGHFVFKDKDGRFAGYSITDSLSIDQDRNFKVILCSSWYENEVLCNKIKEAYNL